MKTLFDDQTKADFDLITGRMAVTKFFFGADQDNVNTNAQLKVFINVIET